MTTVEDNTKRQFVSRNIQESENKTEKGEMNGRIVIISSRFNFNEIFNLN